MNLGVAGLLAVLALAFFIESLRLLPLKPESGDVGPGLFPALLSALLAVLLVVAGIREFRTQRAADGGDAGGLDKQSVAVIGAYVVLIIGAAVLVRFAGVFVAIAVSSLVLLRFFERVSWFRTVLFTAGLIVTVYLTFVTLIGLRLPLFGQ